MQQPAIEGSERCVRDNRGDDLALAGEVARSLRFAPRLVELADRVLQDVTDGGKKTFNGLHLRLESDAAPWLNAMGGAKVGLSFKSRIQTPELISDVSAHQ